MSFTNARLSEESECALQVCEVGHFLDAILFYCVSKLTS